MSTYEAADLTSVSKTMLLTLHARAEHTLSERPRFTDPAAVELVSRLDYDFTMAKQDRLMADGVVLRTLTLDPLVAGYLDTHPGCTVVNIACGLDTRFQRLDDGRVTWYDLDLPDVIALRRRLLEDGERHRTIAASALDPDWPDQLEDMSSDVLVIIEGLSMYLEQEEVRTLLDIIAARLPGATASSRSCPACSRSTAGSAQWRTRVRATPTATPVPRSSTGRCPRLHAAPRRSLHPHHRVLSPPARAPDAAAAGGQARRVDRGARAPA